MSDYISQTITVSSCQSDISNQCRIKTPCITGLHGGGGAIGHPASYHRQNALTSAFGADPKSATIAYPTGGGERAVGNPPTQKFCDIPSGCCSFTGPGQSPVLPFARCVGLLLSSAAAAGALAGVVSAFAEPSGWCAGAVLDVAGCAVWASVAPSSWRIEVVLVVARVV